MITQVTTIILDYEGLVADDLSMKSISNTNANPGRVEFLEKDRYHQTIRSPLNLIVLLLISNAEVG